jgi:hypothetical protein
MTMSCDLVYLSHLTILWGLCGWKATSVLSWMQVRVHPCKPHKKANVSLLPGPVAGEELTAGSQEEILLVADCSDHIFSW